jgi:hypothetical protein
MIKKIAITFFIAINIQITLKAQNLNYFGLFPVYNQNGNIYKKWDYSLFFFSAINTFNQTIKGVDYPPNVFLVFGEAALAYNVNRKFSIAGAYVYQGANVFNSDYVSENRLYQQITYKHFINEKTTLRHRLRFDERFIQDRETGKAPLSHRLRYLFGIETVLSEKLYFTVYNEVFFTTSTPKAAFYSENWAYAAIGFKTKKMGNFEAGPIFITWVRDAAQDRINLWYLQLTWITTLNFSKQNY